MNSTSVEPLPARVTVGKLNSRLPSLDGWRALSILHVLGSHCPRVAGFPPELGVVFFWAFDGDMGVRLFFVISGFLITWLLLKEDALVGRIALGRFYVRRALRILPVYGAYIAMLVLLQWLTPFRQSPEAWIGNLTFTTNFTVAGNWTSAHLWSIAVEEQFYFLWPSLIVVFGLARNFRVACWVLCLPLAVAPLCRVLTYVTNQVGPLPFFAHLFSHNSSFFNYFDSLAIGCLGAFLYHQKLNWLHSLVSGRRTIVAFFVAIVLVAGPYVLVRIHGLHGKGLVTIPFAQSLQGIGLLILLLQSLLLTSARPYCWLEHPIARHIGVLSYSIYIWQQVFCTRPEVFAWGGELVDVVSILAHFSWNHGAPLILWS